MMGVNQDEVALTCTGKGYLPWQVETGKTLFIPCFYSPNAVDTIISPTDVILSHPNLFTAFVHYGGCKTGNGYVTFYRAQGTTHAIYFLVIKIGLWFWETVVPQLPSVPCLPPMGQPVTVHAMIKYLISQVRFIYYHNKWGKHLVLKQVKGAS
jgi:hypothetical protein